MAGYAVITVGATGKAIGGGGGGGGGGGVVMNIVGPMACWLVHDWCEGRKGGHYWELCSDVILTSVDTPANGEEGWDYHNIKTFSLVKNQNISENSKYNYVESHQNVSQYSGYKYHVK